DVMRFAAVQSAIAKKLLPETISSGIDLKTVLLPRANLSTSMSIYLNLGLSEEEVIQRVTSNAARAINRPQLGNLNVGATADIACVQIRRGKLGFRDSGLERLDAVRRCDCKLTVRNGAIVWDSDGLSVPDTVRAGPYTNFK